MKRVLYGIFSLIILLVLTNCEGDEGQPGPAGPQGPQGLQGIEGPQGPIGVDGNANVRQYTFGAFDFSTGGFAQLTVSTTLDTMNRSAWHTYLLYAPINRWYLVPGLGPGGTTNYRISMGHFGGKVNIYIDKAGTGESFSEIRVVRVYANSVMPGGREEQFPDINFENYEEVRQYYGLDE